MLELIHWRKLHKICSCIYRYGERIQCTSSTEIYGNRC